MHMLNFVIIMEHFKSVGETSITELMNILLKIKLNQCFIQWTKLYSYGTTKLLRECKGKCSFNLKSIKEKIDASSTKQ